MPHKLPETVAKKKPKISITHCCHQARRHLSGKVNVERDHGANTTPINAKTTWAHVALCSAQRRSLFGRLPHIAHARFSPAARLVRIWNSV